MKNERPFLVELKEPDTKGARMIATVMPLSEAIETFLSWPTERQNHAMLTSRIPIPTLYRGRVLRRYSLNAWDIRALIDKPAPRPRRVRPRRRYRVRVEPLSDSGGTALATMARTALTRIRRLFPRR